MTEPVLEPALTRRTALIGAAATLAGAAAFAVVPRKRDGAWQHAPLAQLIPSAVGGWRSREDLGIILPETELADRNYDATVSRTYYGAGLPDLMLVIAHGGAQSTNWGVHRPEGCYAGAGFDVTGVSEVTWPIGTGRRVPGRVMTATRGDRIEQVGYWRRIADAFPVTGGDERDVTLRRRLQGWMPDGVLVRMSLVTPDAAAAHAAIAEFAAALVAASGADARRLMLGSLSVRTGAGSAR